ncbi:MAG: SDR family oxidoreductase, partial [Candidatus Lokiarchaeota archaeon]|nr:SDR family oxidoreductase [Candidatus Lokiarchaeota archaeon]MBD3198933.1 SDR family oxidoreductase [Candidatus Lokiarchaeota archaeon]
MDLGLINKVALVLASSKGLGLACAKEFYREGANVMICSRTEENLKNAKNLIESVESLGTNNRILYFKCDLNSEKEIKALIESTMDKFGQIDIVVHNAGGPPSGSIENITSEQWETSIRLNLRSFIKISREVIPIMQQQQQGRIIAITSVSVKQPLENLVLSNTTRLGVVGFAKTLANEYAKDGILVNVVCPGPTLTDRMKELIEAGVKDTGKSEQEVKEKWTNQIPLGRLGEPEELANLVVFLASECA